MKFEMWSTLHIIYILSPIILSLIFYFALRKTSPKVKYIIGIIIGIINIGILLTRNINLYLEIGLDNEVIPLQVCHLGNIIVGIGLISKNKECLIIGFCFNLIPAYGSIIYADSLVNYQSILTIRAMSYIFGHLFIVVGAIYGIMMYKPRVSFKNGAISYSIVIVLMILAIILNPLFRTKFGCEANYFYIYNSDGVPFEFLYDLGKMYTYGWFSINYVYVFSLLVIFTLIYIGLYWIIKLVYKKNKNNLLII